MISAIIKMYDTVCKNSLAADGHFGCPKITFDRISGRIRSIQNLNFLFFFTKWRPAPILDVRNSLSIACLAISDRYTTLFFLEILTKWLLVAAGPTRKKVRVRYKNGVFTAAHTYSGHICECSYLQI